MANIFTNNYKNKLAQGSFVDLSSATVKVALLDTGVVTPAATLDNFDDISAAVVGTPQTLASKTFGALGAGIFDAADVTFPAVSGNSVECLVLYVDTGTPATSQIIAFIDQVASGLPTTPNGSDIGITWDAINGILKIG